MRKVMYSLLSVGTLVGVYIAFFHQGGALPPALQVDSLEWNPATKYALIVGRDYEEQTLKDETVVVKYNPDKRASEYIKVQGRYNSVLKTKDGLALKKNQALLCLNNQGGTLVEGRCNDDVTRNLQRVNISTEYVKEDDHLELKRVAEYKDGFNSDLFLDQSTEKTYDVPDEYRNFGEKNHVYVSDVS